ncbi:hypothetical protein HOY80DRAFT_1020322 [Tuber brumale]|nr:hypothetical protein HOY80DRAFT_1020322 [Tuber brumale]
MDIGSALELLRIADICLRAGQSLCERYKDTRSAHRDLDYLNTRVENVWKDIGSQLRTLQSSWEAIPEILRGRMVDLLHELQYCLHTAYRNLEKTTDKRERAVTKKMKFALFQKRSLQKDASVLEKLRDKFTTTVFMLSIPESHQPDRIATTEVRQNPQPVGSVAIS